MKRRLILDVDTGTDDAIAIMLAALHPELDLVACTTVNGNVDVRRATDNTLRVLDFIGRGDIPVYEGVHRPVARKDFPSHATFETTRAISMATNSRCRGPRRRSRRSTR
jgi:inosine-uridine nucleoside N-ribohydrolase